MDVICRQYDQWTFSKVTFEPFSSCDPQEKQVGVFTTPPPGHLTR